VNKNRMLQLFGWCGVSAILVAYILLSFDYLVSSSILFQLLNLTGALGVAMASSSKKDYPPVALNIVWALVALFAIFRIVLS
jgi:hypothetical protein